jgi:hypothetical protein
MKFFRLDLLTLLISLFIFNSCKRQDGIGLGINESNQINGTFVVDSNIVINTVADDPVTTTALAKTPIGTFDDPVFGNTTAGAAVVLSLPGNAAYTVPAGTLTIDSAVLVLRYANGFYGDSLNTRYTVNVTQLAENVGTQAYLNTKAWKEQPTIWGTKTFTARTHDSVTIANIRVGKVDTIQKVGPQLRIPFSTKFIYDNLFNANGSTLNSIQLFQTAIKGLYIKINKAQASSVGGLFQTALDSSRIDVFYKRVNAGVTDTAVASLPFVSHSAYINHLPSDVVKAALASKTASQNVVYLQSAGGTRAEISFPGLSKFNPDSIVLNRAELVIIPVANSGIPFAPLPKLTMYRLDIAKQRDYIQDAATSLTATSADPRSVGAGTFGGWYQPYKAQKEYHFIITSYIQDLIRKKAVDYGTFIAPIDTTEVVTVGGVGVTSIAPSAQTNARSVLVGNDNTTPNRVNHVKLNIIYTKIKK